MDRQADNHAGSRSHPSRQQWSGSIPTTRHRDDRARPGAADPPTAAPLFRTRPRAPVRLRPLQTAAKSAPAMAASAAPRDGESGPTMPAALSLRRAPASAPPGRSCARLSRRRRLSRAAGHAAPAAAPPRLLPHPPELWARSAIGPRCRAIDAGPATMPPPPRPASRPPGPRWSVRESHAQARSGCSTAPPPRRAPASRWVSVGRA